MSDETSPTGVINLGTGDLMPPTGPVTPGGRWRRYLWPAAAAAAVLAIAAAIVGGVAGRNAATPAPSPSAPAAITVYGQVQLEVGQYEWSQTPRDCWGRPGYDDLKVGGPVVVTDAAGKTVGVGRIDSSRVQVDINGNAEGCQLLFSVRGVAGSAQFYGVAVGHRQPVQYQRSELDTAISLKI